MKRVEGWFVDWLEALCAVLDRLPVIWYVPEYGWSFVKWNGALGCLIGVAGWAVRLDDHWQTERWQSPTKDFYEDDEPVDVVEARFAELIQASETCDRTIGYANSTIRCQLLSGHAGMHWYDALAPIGTLTWSTTSGTPS